jgi:hypothetical protein
MRTKLLFAILISIISLPNLNAQNPTSNVDSLKSHNIQDSMIVSLNNKINFLEIQIQNANKPSLTNALEFASFVVGFMAFILSLFLAWATYISYLRIKEANDRIIETKVTIKEANESIDTFKKDSRLMCDIFENNVKLKIEGFDKESNRITKEIQNILKEFTEKIEKINKIEREVSTQQTYLHQSLENVYELFLFVSNINKDKTLLREIFINRAVGNLYSFDEKERFTSITTLGEIGDMSNIKHLENVLLNILETDKNKLLANNAIVNIKTKERK